MERQDLEASKTTVEQSEKLWQCIRSVDHRERAVRRRNTGQELHPSGKAAFRHCVGRRLDGMPRTAPAPLDMIGRIGDDVFERVRRQAHSGKISRRSGHVCGDDADTLLEAIAGHVGTGEVNEKGIFFDQRNLGRRYPARDAEAHDTGSGTCIEHALDPIRSDRHSRCQQHCINSGAVTLSRLEYAQRSAQESIFGYVFQADLRIRSGRHH